MNRKRLPQTFERILFLTIALLLIMVVWMGSSVYNRLNQVSETQLPTDFLENSRFLIRELNNNILKSDNLSYAYLYQADGNARLDFEILESQTMRKLNLLRSYKKSDIPFQQQVDQLDTLVNQRFANLDTIMDIKNENRVDETMQLVSNQVEQAALETNLKIQITQEAQKQTEPQKKKLFKRKEKTENTSSNLDAQSIANQSAQSISNKIQHVRKQAVSKEDNQNSFKWKLEQRNIELSKAINSIFQSIDLNEKNELVFKTLEAKNVANETNQIILSFSGMSIVFIALIVLLIIILFRKSKETNTQLRLAKEKSDRLTEIKSLFLATMSHEIRTPLNAINGFTDQLSYDKLPQKSAKMVGIIQSSVKHLVQITDEILDLSKLEKNEIELEHVPFNPQNEIESVVDQFRFLLENQGNKLQISIQPNLSNFVGDPLRFRQILINLIGNANKFTKSGVISVGAAAEENRLKLNISDNGIGMNENQLERIFEPFEQADSSVTRKYGGTGLGLTITKQLVEKMNGTITVQSKPGEGTSFEIILALEKTSESIDKKEQITPVSFDFLEGKHVLIADDEPFNRTLLKSIFHPTTIILHEAENGIEALNKIDEFPINLALVDVRMPEMDGHDLVLAIRERKKNFPIIGLTATLDTESKQQMLENGWTEVLTKPVKPAELKQVILETMNQEDLQLDTISLEGLMTLTNNNMAFYNELIDTFIKSTSDGISKMQELVNAQNWLELGALAHQLAAPFKHFEAQHCYETLKQIEQIGKENSNTDQLPQLVKKIVKQAGSVIHQIIEKR